MEVLKEHNIRRKKKLLFWIIQICIWTLYFFYNYRFVHHVSYSKRPDQFFIVVAYLFLFSYFGLALTLFMRMIIKRMLKKQKKILFLIFVLIITSILLANVWFAETLLLDFAVAYLQNLSTTPINWSLYSWEMFSASLLLISWGAVYLFIQLYESWHEEKTKTAHALLAAETANLNILRNQLNPHFLFNSLGSLRALIREDKVSAEDMLNKITEFLRYTLVKKNVKEIPLKEEIGAIKNYLDIEKIRYGKKMQTDFNIEEAALYFLVPPFILHPLIENAVKYGILTAEETLAIAMKGEILHNDLYLEISNSGSWYDNPKHQGTQTGIRNVKERLEIHYPNAHNFSIVKGKDLVKIKLFLKRKVKNDEKNI